MPTPPIQHKFRGDISLAGYGPNCFHTKCFDCGAEYRFQTRTDTESWVWSHTLDNGINIFLCRSLRDEFPYVDAEGTRFESLASAGRQQANVTWSPRIGVRA